MNTGNSPGDGAGNPRAGENNLRITSEIIILIALIFLCDILTPLGLAIWILYFIPLFLTLYLEWRYGTLVITGIIITLISASFFFSSQDISLLYAILNRVFFYLMLIASAFLIENYRTNAERLRRSEENYRILVEWSPEGIIVCRDDTIQYANLVFLRLFAADDTDNPVGRAFNGLIHPASQQIVRERMSQAAMGAQVRIPDVDMIRPDGSELRADLTMREIVWDHDTAVLIIIRPHCSG